jgi:hypothetical protein
MNYQEQEQSRIRLRDALTAFQSAQLAYLSAHRKIKDHSAAEADAFWDSLGLRLEATLRASAKEVMVAFDLFSAVGLVATASDRHLVTEAKRSLV